jgi:L-alanine-DL-glutamate epimerase-like enolase superfamily enzyme
MSAQAEEFAREGAKTLFTKVGFDALSDEEAVKAIRRGASQAGVDVPIRIDANQSWTPAAAIRNIRRMERYGLEYVEQPVSMHNLDGMAHVRNSVDTPILAHESCWTFYNALNVIKKEAADALQLDPRFDVGFMGVRIAAGIAEAAGMPACIHSWNDLGIFTCAKIHLAASMPNFTLPSQSLYENLTDDVIRERLRFEGRSIRVPEKAGLGFELDDVKVQEYSKHYLMFVKGKESAKELSPFGRGLRHLVNIPGAEP